MTMPNQGIRLPLDTGGGPEADLQFHLGPNAHPYGGPLRLTYFDG
jgi:hypothetical protein